MIARLGWTLAALLLAWGVWAEGGAVLGWVGLDALDVPGRVVLVIAALSLADAALARIPPRR